MDKKWQCPILNLEPLQIVQNQQARPLLQSVNQPQSSTCDVTFFLPQLSSFSWCFLGGSLGRSTRSGQPRVLDPYSLYIGNLPFTATEDKIGAFFAKCGKVAQVRIITDPETGRSRGYESPPFSFSRVRASPFC